ncbi:DUF349 domain-containing protein [Gynuella sunshinyii]|uniref:DUF349 domain-containing protein n=1 Tax=Gynuella sunshinyii YC6258 TaxID=1445510 RepID=A0A0C5VPR7_9GAMM|nr:DUF349 domain-containing protein [Gynuella sunshinyii]AJQ96627.1 hypothetical Protein YC6258_04595 [Gynuella sunshinyii YC6258]
MVISKFFKKQKKQTQPEIKPSQPAPSSTDMLIAKIKTVTDPSELLTTAQQSDEALQKAAKNRFAALIDEGQLTPQQLSALTTDTGLILSILAFSKQKNLLEQQLTSLSQPQLCEQAIKGGTAELRKTAAGLLTEADVLEQLTKATKGKDKTVYRIAKDKLNEIQECLTAEATRRAALQQLLDSAGKLANTPFDPLLNGKIKNLQLQWQELEAEPTEAQQQQFDKALTSAQKTYDEHMEQLAAEEELAKTPVEPEPVEETPEPIVEPGRFIEIRKTLHQVLTDQILAMIESEEITEAMLNHADEVLTESQNEWRTTEEEQKASKEEFRAFSHLCTEYEQLLLAFRSLDSFADLVDQCEQDPESSAVEILDQIIHHLDFLASDNQPVVVQHAQTILKDIEARQEQYKKEQHQQIGHIRGLIRKGHWAINQGHLRQAAGITHAIEEKAGHLERIPQSLKQQITQLSEDLEKLLDWQDFAVLPKKKDLLDKMQALVGSDQHPEAIANLIKRFQDEWKLLSKGSQGHHQELWEKFHAAAQEAYQPCKKWFEEQAEMRRRNLTSRQKLVSELNIFLQAIPEQPDFSAIEKAINVAKQQWRTYSPVERQANKPVQQAFDKVMGDIQGVLNQQYQAVKEQKKDIVEKARELLEMDNFKAATNKAKDLQKEWQETGKTWRKEEQKLWKEFRAVCDELFGRRDEHNRQMQAEFDKVGEQAQALIQQAEQLLSNEQLSAQELKQQINHLSHEFTALGRLPRQHQSSLQKSWDTAEQAVHHLIDSKNKSVRVDEWSLFDQLVQTEDAIDQLTAHTWRHVPDPIVKAVSNRQTADTKTTQSLLILMEIMAGLDSPESDASLRMQIQVERLQQGMTQNHTNQEDFSKLLAQWYAIHPIDPTFQRRFLAARNTYLKIK